MDSDAPLLHLIELGLTEYEAKAYLTLLKESPLSAYETAKRAGLPSSKIYEVLERLAQRGVVMQLDEGDKNSYIPKPHEQFLSGREAGFSRVLAALRQELAALGSEGEYSYLWRIRERSELLARALSALSASRREVLLSGFGEELGQLAEKLSQLDRAGVRLASVYFGEPEREGLALAGKLYPHPIKDTLQAEKGGRGFALVCDSTEAIVGTILPDGRVEGAYSRNRGFVLLAEDYIKHDIYIMKIVQRFDPQLIAGFGKDYAELRRVFD